MAIEHQRVRVDKQPYIDLLSRVIECGYVLSSRFSVGELCETITAAARHVFGAEAAWVLLHDPQRGVLDMECYRGPDAEEFGETPVIPGDGICGKVFTTQRAEILSTGGAGGSNDGPLIAALPLTAGYDKLGVIGVLSASIMRSGISLDEAEFALSAFASQVATSIKTVKLFHDREVAEGELTRRIRSLQVLNEIGLDLVKDLDLSAIIRKVAHYAAEMLHADAAAINIGNKEGTEVEAAYFYNMPQRMEKSLLEKHALCTTMLRHPRRVLINNYPDSSWAMPEFIQAGVKSMVMVPVTSRARVLATLSALSFSAARHFTGDDLDELELIASHVAIAIENAQLYREQVETGAKLEAYAAQLRMLNHFSNDINREREPQEMADKLAHCARTLLGCAAAIVILHKQASTCKPTLSSSIDSTCSWDMGPLLEELELTGRRLELSASDGLYGEMLRTKRPLRLTDPAAHPKSTGVPDNHIELRGLLGAPLLDSEGRFIGQVMLTDKQGGEFTESDEELLVALCSQVAVGIEKAEAFEREHVIAEALQQAILAVPEHLPGVEVGIIYESAAEVAKVGGDFYDLFEVGDNKIAILIGDVSGKGLKAATITSMVKSTIRAFAYKGLSPARVLEEANKVIYRQLSLNQFITMIYAVLDTESGKLMVARAGHPDMIIWRDGGCKLCEIDSNLPLGVFPEIDYEENEVNIGQADGVIFYTDGLIEARSGKKLLGEEFMMAELNRVVQGKDPQGVAAELINMAKVFSGGKPQDDIAVVVLRVKRKEQSAD